MITKKPCASAVDGWFYRVEYRYVPTVDGKFESQYRRIDGAGEWRHGMTFRTENAAQREVSLRMREEAEKFDRVILAGVAA